MAARKVHHLSFLVAKDAVLVPPLLLSVADAVVVILLEEPVVHAKAGFFSSENRMVL
jgi:hypothetical protein